MAWKYNVYEENYSQIEILDFDFSLKTFWVTRSQWEDGEGLGDGQLLI